MNRATLVQWMFMFYSQKPKVYNSCTLEPLAFRDWQIRTAWILRIVHGLISCYFSESLAQVYSKYLEVNFCGLGFTILKILHENVEKNKEEFLLLSSAAHILMPHVCTELRPYETCLVGVIWYSHPPYPYVCLIF